VGSTGTTETATSPDVTFAIGCLKDNPLAQACSPEGEPLPAGVDEPVPLCLPHALVEWMTKVLTM
jgi:hypothetical protein